MPSKILILLILSATLVRASFFSFSNFANYARTFYVGNLTAAARGNELWTGILRDCSGKLTFSCIQKNAYTYLDDTLVAPDNITLFDGFVMKKNSLNVDSCIKNCQDDIGLKENLVEPTEENSDQENVRKFQSEMKSPLEEITSALRDKTVKFLATRDYELQLPDFFFQSSRIKISPREIDEDGALVRIDFGQKVMENEGRLFFKRIRKFIQNRLLMSFLALILIIKLIKVKFMFIIPFLFGVGTAKKLFLKLLLFLVPAFAHVFKLCSSYWNSHSKLHHHHHHKIAHHHHHVPVPVPVPTYIDHAPHHHFSHDDYPAPEYGAPPPHLQFRKDLEELQEWGIDSYADTFEEPPPGSSFPAASYGVPQFPSPGKPNLVPNALPTGAILSPGQGYSSPIAPNSPTLSYNGPLDDPRLSRRVFSTPQAPQQQQLPPQQELSTRQTSNGPKPGPKINLQPAAISSAQPPRPTATQKIYPSTKSVVAASNSVEDDPFYSPIVQRLDHIFAQLRFTEETCRQRLICSMYKKPEIYSPHSNLVSNELSRDPQELKRGMSGSASSQRFYRYINAARLGQDGGDCLRNYPCQINTE